MAAAGRGRLHRAATYAQLPEVVHRLVREVFRVTVSGSLIVQVQVMVDRDGAGDG
jgi:hypothetical protein